MKRPLLEHLKIYYEKENDYYIKRIHNIKVTLSDEMVKIEYKNRTILCSYDNALQELLLVERVMRNESADNRNQKYS